MEKSWRIPILCVCLVVFCECCCGFPINYEFSSTTTKDSYNHLVTGLIAVLLTVCCIVFLAGCLCCQQRNGFKEFHNSGVTGSTSLQLDHGHVNPVSNVGEFTIFTPLQNNNVFYDYQLKTIAQESYNCDDVDVNAWIRECTLNFPRSKLKYIKELGKGWFGRVVEGAVQDLQDVYKWKPVVVRILEATASRRERVSFLHDIIIYRCCDAHPNILQIYGICLDTSPLLVLQESCSQGDLKRYLLQHKHSAGKLLSSEHPLLWSCALTSAVKHLHDNKLVHPDLATRTCLLTSNLQVKLGDYGLAVEQYPDDYYQGAAGVPIRWCAPESVHFTPSTIQPRKATPEANIWALAVTLWEICECGQQPYSHLNDDEVITHVLESSRVRLSRPTNSVLYTEYIYNIMKMCWTSFESRPNAIQIDLMLSDLLRTYRNTSKHQEDSSNDDFERRWKVLKPNNNNNNNNNIAAAATRAEKTVSSDVDVSNNTSSNNLVHSSDDMMASDDGNSCKPALSLSLNNLHGSLDNLPADGCLLAEQPQQMDSWLADVANTTDDFSFVQGLSEAIKDLDETLSREVVSPTTSLQVEFQLGPMQEDEEEGDSINAKDNGVYTEKVRQKSRSVTDLMVLTHIDYSESESDTPLPSLDGYFNGQTGVLLRPGPKSIEGANLKFGSDGNLAASVQDTFQVELRKLQEERKNSLLFVPEKRCSSPAQDDCKSEQCASTVTKWGNFCTDNNRLLHELNSPSEIKPVDQVFNVFNVTIYNSSNALFLNQLVVDNSNSNNSNSNKNINIKSPVDQHHHNDSCKTSVDNPVTNLYHQVPKLVDIIQENPILIDYIISRYDKELLVHSESEEDVSVRTALSQMRHEHEGDDSSALRLLLTDNTSNNNSRLSAAGDDLNQMGHVNNVQSMQRLSFDLSATQSQITPNTLTHLNLFSSTFTVAGDRRPQNNCSSSSLRKYSSLDFLDKQPEEGRHMSDANNDDMKALFSIEAWDNYLRTVLDSHEPDTSCGRDFDAFGEPHSLLFVEHGDVDDVTSCHQLLHNIGISNENCTRDNAFESVDIQQQEQQVQRNSDDLVNSDIGGNQSQDSTHSSDWKMQLPNVCEVMTQFDCQSDNSVSVVNDSYIGYRYDDEAMTAIRNELVNKLPQAQDAFRVRIPENIESEEEVIETDSFQPNEVYISYNLYGTPLSPIMEEESLNDISELFGQQQLITADSNSEASDWSTDECNAEDAEIDSVTPVAAGIVESPKVCHRPTDEDTPSRDSCCSNDTLFNLEELIAGGDTDDAVPAEGRLFINQLTDEIVAAAAATTTPPEEIEISDSNSGSVGKNSIVQQYGNNSIRMEQTMGTNQSCSLNATMANQCPSPLIEDFSHQYSSINTSLSTKNTENQVILISETELKCDSHPTGDGGEGDISKEVEEETFVIANGSETVLNEEIPTNTLLRGILSDIRFSGPTNADLITTSFTEDTTANTEEDWDSGSDSRTSSSSGEFIWREGEHEESLRVLHAASSQDNNTSNASPLKADYCKRVSDEDDSENEEEDGDDESPDFVPSTWNKYATPLKSALRSPEKKRPTEKTEKKKETKKSVWFKKQKYHCIYEYPKEPTSPIVQNYYNMWHTAQDYLAFPGDQDDEFYISSSAHPFNMLSSSGGGSTCEFFPGGGDQWRQLLRNKDNTTPDSGIEDGIPTTPIPPPPPPPSAATVPTLKALSEGALSRVKSPDNSCSYSTVISSELPSTPPPLSPLSQLGRLRHTRGKLKLNLPPSPNALTSTYTFNLEGDDKEVADDVFNLPTPPPSVPLPTFTTFGKSRFSVQHVDESALLIENGVSGGETNKAAAAAAAPTRFLCDVSFEALPHKPAIWPLNCTTQEQQLSRNHRRKVEVVRGEASFLDSSADEDSGIESSGVERKQLCAPLV